MMPAPDGYEVCSRIKNDPVLRHAQVIMVSAKTELDDRLRGYHAGADDYVTKPFDEDELVAKVHAGINLRASHRQMRAQLKEFCGAAGDVFELITQLRDAETGDHLARIRSYSGLLAAELQAGPWGAFIDEQFLEDFERASAMHDIGKIAIPDAIFRKPGPLTESERALMQQHTVLGEAILRRLAAEGENSGMFRMAAEIARSHHEFFDGSGYPDGLRGDCIPLSARIVKVADVFDAVTSARVYKPAYTPDHAREVITCGRGAEFDPDVVDALLHVFDIFAGLCEAEGQSSAAEPLLMTTAQG